MKKVLTEIHLMMERTDFVYVADEIVKHYNLPTKVKFSKYGSKNVFLKYLKIID